MVWLYFVSLLSDLDGVVFFVCCCWIVFGFVFLEVDFGYPCL